MVRHWFSERGSGWRRSALINGVGAFVTAVVVVVIAVSKFDQGVWMIIIVVPVLIALMLFIKHEYDRRVAAWRSSRTSSSGRRTAASELWSRRRR